MNLSYGTFGYGGMAERNEEDIESFPFFHFETLWFRIQTSDPQRILVNGPLLHFVSSY